MPDLFGLTTPPESSHDLVTWWKTERRTKKKGVFILDNFGGNPRKKVRGSGLLSGEIEKKKVLHEPTSCEAESFGNVVR